MKIFVDTWGWLTLLDQKESKHLELKEFYSHFRNQRGIVYTSDYVLDETITLLFRRLPFETAKGILVKLEKAINTGYILVKWINHERFDKAKELRFKYQDKPKISFTDLTSMVVMKELDVKDIITGDEHFKHVGMGFQRKP